MTKYFIIALIMVISLGCSTQKNGYNYYPLPDKVKETSGIFIHENKLYTHNDSGDGPYLYSMNLDKLHSIKSHKLLRAKNKDWEDITYNSNYIFIGDIGNNKGKRKKLTYYRIPIDLLDQEVIDKDAYQEIKFIFKNKDLQSIRVNVEAMIYDKGKLYFFSKEKSGRTKIFELSEGEDQAVEIAEISIPFRITSADLKNETVYILGYNKKQGKSYHSKMGIIEHWGQTSWDKIKFNPLDINFDGQAESIFINEDKIFISTEKNLQNSARLYILSESEIRNQ